MRRNGIEEIAGEESWLSQPGHPTLGVCCEARARDRWFRQREPQCVEAGNAAFGAELDLGNGGSPVDHPQVVDNYRAAHAIALRNYLVVTREIDPAANEDVRVEHVMKGYRADTYTQIERLVFMAFFERAHAVRIGLADMLEGEHSRTPLGRPERVLPPPESTGRPRPQRAQPDARRPDRDRMPHRRRLRGLVAESREDGRSLPRGPPEDRVDESRPGASRAGGQGDAVTDRGVSR